MRFLLDTHVYLWCVRNDPHLSTRARDLILTADEIYVSSVSILEAAIKTKLKKLDADVNVLVNSISKSGFIDLPVTSKHAVCLYDMPDFHKDPFDRLLIAQAISEPLRFLTADKSLKQYSELVELI